MQYNNLQIFITVIARVIIPVLTFLNFKCKLPFHVVLQVVKFSPIPDMNSLFLYFYIEQNPILHSSLYLHHTKARASDDRAKIIVYKT